MTTPEFLIPQELNKWTQSLTLNLEKSFKDQNVRADDDVQELLILELLDMHHVLAQKEVSYEEALVEIDILTDSLLKQIMEQFKILFPEITGTITVELFLLFSDFVGQANKILKSNLSQG
jgi:hypothetical protein